MATPSPAESAFQQALKTYKEQLTEKELARIEIPTSLDDLAKAGKTLGSGNQKALRLLEAFEAARVHLAPLQGLLQGVCKLSPKGGDLIWASVNFVFDVCGSTGYPSQDSPRSLTAWIYVSYLV